MSHELNGSVHIPSFFLAFWPLLLANICMLTPKHYHPLFGLPIIISHMVIFLPSSGIASYVGTLGMAMCHLHLTTLLCSSRADSDLGLNPNWLRSFVNRVFPLSQKVLYHSPIDNYGGTNHGNLHSKVRV